MSDYETPPTSPAASRLSLWQVWLGMALFGPFNVLVLFLVFINYPRALDARPLLWAAILAVCYVVLAALLYFGLHLHGCAAGILLGYVLLSLTSGGVCTLLADEEGSSNGQAVLVLYPGAIVLLGLGIGIYKFVKR